MLENNYFSVLFFRTSDRAVIGSIIAGTSSLAFYAYDGATTNLLYIWNTNTQPLAVSNGRQLNLGDIDGDSIDEATYGIMAFFNTDRVSVFKLGGVYSYGSGTLTATWIPVSGLGSQGAVSFTGFNPGEQNICIALSGSPLNPGAALPSGDFVYVNPNDPNFWIDCSFSADFAGTVTFPGINIQNAAVAGQKVYAQAAVSRSGQIYTSNGLEITFLA